MSCFYVCCWLKQGVLRPLTCHRHQGRADAALCDERRDATCEALKQQRQCLCSWQTCPNQLLLKNKMWECSRIRTFSLEAASLIHRTRDKDGDVTTCPVLACKRVKLLRLLKITSFYCTWHEFTSPVGLKILWERQWLSTVPGVSGSCDTVHDLPHAQALFAAS